MDIAKQANELVKKAVALMKDEDAAARFASVAEVFDTATANLNDNPYNEAMLKGWMVSQANNAIFTLWQQGKLDDDLEAEYRTLPSTKEAVKDFEDFEKAAQEEAAALEEKRAEFMNKQHETDIFKAILNGMSKEKAEQEYKNMQEQVARARNAQ